MRFSVLGPVRVWRGDHELRLGPPKQRALLALLLVQAGRPVPVHDIVDTLWGQAPPDSAVNVVQRHVGLLRRVFEPGLPTGGSSGWLLRTSGGYRLDVPAGSLDLLRLREAREEAARSAAGGDPAAAAEALAEALGMWQGPVASDIPPEIRANPVFGAVDREIVAAAKEAAGHAVRAGTAQIALVLPVLSRASALHPLDEDLHAQLVTALAAIGHRAEALRVYDTVRERLEEELGLDPGEVLQAAWQGALRGDPPVDPAWSPALTRTHATDGEDPAPSTAEYDTDVAAGPGLCQLPVQLPTFTGRVAELQELNRLLPAEGPPPGTVITAVVGMAGVGKTALAVTWAHQVADRFPDGQLYVDLRGFHSTGSVMSEAEALRSLLDGLGVPAQRMPPGLDGQVALYRSLLKGRRVLIVLDNARDSKQVRRLLPAAAGCLAVVTSRNQLTGLVAEFGAHCVTLGPLTESDAMALLTRRIGAARVARELGACAEIIARCGRLPLALAILGARVVVEPAYSLEAVLAELRDGRSGLDAFNAEAPLADARSVFSWSYHALSPGAARLFRLLALHPGPDWSVAAAASLAGLDVTATRPLLKELLWAHLTTRRAGNRFFCHDLLRAHATELLAAEESQAEVTDAWHRLLDHYLHTAHAADTVVFPHRERVPLRPPVPGTTVTRPADLPAALDWMTAERSVLITLVTADTPYGGGAQRWRLAAVLERHLDRAGRWQEQEVAQKAAVALTEELGDLSGQAYAYQALGFACVRLEQWEAAERHLARALVLLIGTSDPDGQAVTHRYLAYLANVRRRHDEALGHYLRASALYRLTGRRGGEGSVRNEMGWTYLATGALSEAREQCEQAIALNRQIGHRGGEAAAWDTLGSAYERAHDRQRALTCCQRALELYRDIHDRSMEADTLAHIGSLHSQAGDRAGAERAWRDALAILEELDHPDAEGVRARLAEVAAPKAVVETLYTGC
jgi:DNA-binding SARP family transcriptional activator/tetratricopeptide (TPR) repeat protein